MVSAPSGSPRQAAPPKVARAAEALPVAEAVLAGRLSEGGGRFEATDLRWLDGEDLRGRPSGERRDLLDSVLANADGTIVLVRAAPPRAPSKPASKSRARPASKTRARKGKRQTERAASRSD
jgi:hypothetical protein